MKLSSLFGGIKRDGYSSERASQELCELAEKACCRSVQSRVRTYNDTRSGIPAEAVLSNSPCMLADLIDI